MRLVSEALYKQLFDKDKEKSDHMLEQKEQVLQRKDISDDMKSQLYHHAVRSLESSLKEDQSQPLPVLQQTEKTAYDTELDSKSKLLDTWLKINNFVEKDNGTFTIAGASQGNTLMKTLKKYMLEQTNSTSKIPSGYNEAQREMRKRGMRPDFFKVKQQKGSGVKRKPSKKKTMKKKFKEVMWESY